MDPLFCRGSGFFGWLFARITRDYLTSSVSLGFIQALVSQLNQILGYFTIFRKGDLSRAE
jgi:hypothetical protein